MILIASSYNEFRFKLLGMAANFGYDSQTAEDLVQQFFLDLIQKKLPENIRNPDAFISTAFKRKLIDQYRAEKRQTTHAVKADWSELVPSQQEILEKLEDDRAMLDNLAEAFQKLPPRCRRVIYMKYYLAYSTSQISKVTGLCEQNIYNNLSNGIKQLRRELVKSIVDKH